LYVGQFIDKQGTALKALKPSTLFAGCLLSLNCFAEEIAQPSPEQAEPAALILLVLGLVALFIGIRNVGDLRHKRMLPPRPDSPVADKKSNS